MTTQTNLIDEQILKFATKRWRKIAMIVGGVLFDPKIEEMSLSDSEIALRIGELVAAGHLEARGDVQNMRYSEVRLKPKPRASGCGREQTMAGDLDDA